MKPNSTLARQAINLAKREGWYRWVRQGEGEEADERAIINGCRFDERRADHWLEFADDYGTLTEGPYAGKPFRLLPWQANDTGRLFGWIRFNPEWGYDVRRFRFWYEEVPKKNGKTPLLSLIGNYLMFADCVNPDLSPRQINLYLCATTRKQAERCLTHAIRQIKNNDDLADAATIRKLEGFFSVQYLENMWTVVAANPESADGVNGHCLADEFHRWKGFEFYTALKWMLASQPEGVFAAITTAGEEGENVCKVTHDHAIDVNAGRVIDESFMGTIYAALKSEDPDSEETWFAANPSLGTDADSPIKLSTFRADYENARDDPTEWIGFKRLRLGIWHSTLGGWIDTSCDNGIDDWDSGPTARVKQPEQRIDCHEDFDDEYLIKHETMSRTLGMDLATARDTVAAVISFQDMDDIVRLRPSFWLPEKQARLQRKVVNYQAWAEAGAIKLTKGRAINYRLLLNDMIELIERFQVTRFYYDPLFQAEWFTQELEANTDAERVQFPQNFTHYAPVVAEFEHRIIEQRIRHNSNPVLTWQLQNAKALENTNGGKRIVKPKRGSFKKVDGVQASLMAIRDCLRGEVDNDDDGPIDV